MKIVVEYVLLENLLINLIILKTTSLLLKERSRLCLLSAFFGGCVTVAMPAMMLSKLGYVLIEIGLSMIVICISFKFKTLKKFLGIFLTYFITTLIYGGACYYFENLFGFTSLLIVLLVVVCVFVIMKVFIKLLHRRRNIENFCFDVEIEIDGKKTKWKGFLDSGNLLHDPITNKPVSLINYKVFSSLFKEIKIEDVLFKSERLKKLKSAHYISFNTLGGGDKILVFQVDSLCVAGKHLQKATLGLSFKNFKQAFGSDIILSGSLAS